ncbi:MAG: ParB N-terminal domain-containing protein, partial [Sedimentisphaerales bacterium]|nr:ParB N-terminal domain-containing protein [Sedimentisphaerales bacterium]
QIINGHHRSRALEKLGCESADCIVWDVDDEQVDILLATLNRLGGTDELSEKLKLLKRLTQKTSAKELAKLLPNSAKQIERLTQLKLPDGPMKIAADDFATPMVFFLKTSEQEIVNKALSLAERRQAKMTKAQRNASAITCIAQQFINHKSGGGVYVNP